ncbi:MAG: UvrB/UvrC motif-containing protein [Clostridia bacterium]|nr:UvrB/UvrC motif-containing protein [Clostridia bacterium]MBR3974293.1 UvrB/UvrC motif-containing protein [Clostridia bacterium]
MLCQNCHKNDALMHMKRIKNGETYEIHLCTDCAKALGYSDMFSSLPSSFASVLGAVYSQPKLSLLGNKVLRCETCSFTFEDIARTGGLGCPDCYKVFADKLLPVVNKIHGRVSYSGKIPKSATAETKLDFRIDELKKKLNIAIDEQNFERAAQIRDEIRALSGGEG